MRQKLNLLFELFTGGYLTTARLVQLLQPVVTCHRTCVKQFAPYFLWQALPPKNIGEF